MKNKDIAFIFRRIATYLELKGENQFKVRAYENASKIIESLTEELYEFLDPEKKELSLNIKGLGKSIKEKIVELLLTGKLEYYEKLKSEIPNGLLNMLRLPGLGAKKVKKIYDVFKITTIEELKKLAKEGKLRTLEGFGEKTENKILKAIEMYHGENRFFYSEGISIAKNIVNYLKKSLKIEKIEIAGSLRRKCETIGDIDILISTNDERTMDVFTSYELVKEVINKGKTKSSILLSNGLQVDLRKVDINEFPFALNYFTGSKAHNIHLRKIANSLGYKLNEYGLFYINTGKKAFCKTEEEIYKKLGLGYIPPELREDLGEFEYFKEYSSIRLIEFEDFKGTVHCHTTYSDGHLSLKECVKIALDLGLEYLGIADHSQTAYYAGGLTIDKLEKQWEEIDYLNSKYPLRILKGIESDILPDGSLDYKEDILEKFDFVVASVHSKFNMTEKEMTERIIKAIKNPYTTILGHPTGRLLLQRPPYDVDLMKIIEVCAETHTIIEINGQPKRLDLDWRWVRKAIQMGVKIIITPDSHSREDLENNLFYGINIARKGWLTPEYTINALSTEEFLNLCQEIKNYKKKQIKSI